MTNLIAIVAFLRNPKRNIFFHVIVPVLGFLANVAMLLAILYLGILGGGPTQVASVAAIVVTLIWIIIGIIYLNLNSKKLDRPVIAR
jgi:uncharacterized membrane protein YdbT with pleckstrin-like domain